MRTMREAIMQGPDAHEQYVRDFMKIQFPKGDVPTWAVEALATVGINITTTVTDETPAAVVALAEAEQIESSVKKPKTGTH